MIYFHINPGSALLAIYRPFLAYISSLIHEVQNCVVFLFMEMVSEVSFYSVLSTFCICLWVQ